MIGVFADGSYLWKAWRAVSASNVDYSRLLQLIVNRCDDAVSVAYYYDATHPSVDASARVMALARAGFRVRTHYRVVREKVRWPDGRSAIDPQTGEVLTVERQKGVDVGLALGIVKSLERDRWTKLALIAGDADFSELVQDLVEQHNVEVTLIGHRGSISHSLLPYARQIIDLRMVVSELAFPLRAAIAS
jgi:uncharacterized LabA/DUF88 family protein